MRGRASSYNARARLRSAGYKCSLCGRRMIDAEALKRHNKTVHNITEVTSRNKQITLKTRRAQNVKIGAKQQVLSAKERREVNDKAFDALLKDDLAKTALKPQTFESRVGEIRKTVEQEILAETKGDLKKELPKRAKLSGAAQENVVQIRNGVNYNAVERNIVVKKFDFNITPRNVEFNCPKCEKKFKAYFSAHKHIQKMHCVNADGNKVHPFSTDLIKPIRVEPCLKCEGLIKSTEVHECPGSITDLTDDEINKASFYLCAACNQGFISLRVFDLHVAGLHSDSVHSLFFPTKIEFTNWRLEMERETKTKYFALGEYDSKVIYRCSYAKEMKSTDRTTAHFCPSSMVIQEFTKGIQVHFYKEHYDHEAVEYELLGKYRKYLITSFLKRAENYNVTDLTTDDNDLYMQFKILMENIVLDAAKINIQNLNVLIEKALEMTTILTSYEEEIDECKPHPVPRRMNDEQISEVLQEAIKVTRKRKASLDISKEVAEVTPRARTRSLYVSPTRGSAPVILNSFSLADTDIVLESISIEDENDNVEHIMLDNGVTNESAAKVSDRASRFSQSTSFNDTYKDFVDKTIQATIAADKSLKDKAKKRSPRNTPPLKTKMGQFRPSISPKSQSSVDSKCSEPQRIRIPDKNVRKIVISPTEEIVYGVTTKVPSSKSVSNTSKVNKTTKTSRDASKVRLQSVTRKRDLEYEVREQENDCNILVLKI